MSHTIHNFLDLKALGTKRVIGRYDSPELALANQADAEYDAHEAENPGASCGNLGIEPSNSEAEVPQSEPVIAAPAADGIHATATGAEVSDLSDSNLSPADFAKLVEHGVRPKDAIEAGLCHVSSSAAAFRLDRVDTGAPSGILTPYRTDGGISHCRIMFDEPVTLAGKNKG